MERFWNKVVKSDGCWLWTGALRGGYGGINIDGKYISAHRLSFEIRYGRRPVGILRHTCDVRNCVKPEHLLEGSHADNSQDMMSRGRHGGTLLTNDQVIEMRNMEMTDTILRDLSQKYGVNESTIRSALNGRTYSHLPNHRKIPRQIYRSKLSPEQITEIKEALDSPYWGIGQHLAKKYNVTHSQISHIRTGRIHSEK